MATKKSAKPATKKTAPTKKAAKPITEVMSKATLVAHLAEQTSLDRKSVSAVLAGLESTILASVAKKGAGQFVLPGLIKLQAVAVPAKPKRKARNPFTGEDVLVPAKPATTKLKARILKKLKEAAV